MKMQESCVINEMLCNESDNVEGEEEEILDVEENKMGGIPSEGIPILVHIERFEGGPILANLLQKEIVGDVVNGSVQEFSHMLIHLMNLNVSSPRQKKWLLV